VQLQLHRTVGVGGAVQHRSAQAWCEAVQEFQRTQAGLAALSQLRAMPGAGEQALVLAQGVFDLGIARQRGIVVDAQSPGRFQLGLVVIADSAFGHQPRRLVCKPVAAFAGLALGMLTGPMHERFSPCTTCPDFTPTL